jgi:hypothetical protein
LLNPRSEDIGSESAITLLFFKLELLQGVFILLYK